MHYTEQDVTDIIRQKQEEWMALTKVDIIYSVHGRDKIVYNVLKTVQGGNGIQVQIEV